MEQWFYEYSNHTPIISTSEETLIELGQQDVIHDRITFGEWQEITPSYSVH